MKVIKRLLVTSAVLVAASVVSMVVASIYGDWTYPKVPVHERDVYFDIAFVFLASFAAVILLAAVIAFVRSEIVRRRSGKGHGGIP